MIKQRRGKVSQRGLYLQDSELLETAFKVGSTFKYDVDLSTNTITIKPDGSNTVSRRRKSDGDNPVIDIRSKQALQAFEGCSYLEIEIHEGSVIVKGINDKQETVEAKIPQSYLYKATKDINNIVRTSTLVEVPLRVLSLFSGAGMFDYAFHEDDAFHVVAAAELNKDALLTYRFNSGGQTELCDVRQKNYSYKDQIDVIIGGSPCQGFSHSNRVNQGMDNENSKMVLEFIRQVRSTDCKVFVLENVEGLLTGAAGHYMQLLQNTLSDYELTKGHLWAHEFGSAQKRKRAFIIGSKIGSIQFPKPLPRLIKTVKQAFKGLHNRISNQCDVPQSSQQTIERIKMIPPGGNHESLPAELKTKGVQSNLLRRLEWDKPSITIANVRKSLILHPEENRILSVRECARLFDLPDTFIFKGSLSSKIQQVANGVPLSLGRAIKEQVKKAFRSSFYSKLAFN